MARRLIIHAGFALAVAGALRPATAPAQPGEAPAPAAPRARLARTDAPKGKKADPRAGAPAPALARPGDGLPELAEGAPPADPAAPPAPSPVGDPGASLPPAEASAPPAMPAPPEPAPVDDLRRTSAGAPAGPESAADNPHVLPPERLGPGPQAAGLTVEVQAPPTVNLDLKTWIKLVVRNTGKAEAAGVVVRYLMPEGLEFVSSQPEARPNGPLLTFPVGNLSAGSERILRVQVKPVAVRLMDHAATVTFMTGARAKMVVKQPKLKVEQTVSPEKVLKGQQVKFSITVSNPGTGAARDVTIQAKLSPGLKHEEGGYIEQTLGAIGPGETVPLDPLLVDAVAGGEQTCEVLVASPDVAKDSEEARASKAITVVEPKLKLSLSGHEKRITNTPALYHLTVENPGTATARHVRVTAFLPLGGKLYVPKGTTFDPTSRRLTWTLPQLDPKEKAELDFKVLLGAIGRYPIDAEARGDGLLIDKATLATHVTGMADIQFEVTERTRALDVDEETDFEVRIRNTGSKEATKLLIRAKVSDHLKLVSTSGIEEQAKINPSDPTELLFPPIDRLAPKAELTLAIKARAVKPGVATCRVSLMHDDLGNSTLSRETPVTVMETRR